MTDNPNDPNIDPFEGEEFAEDEFAGGFDDEFAADDSSDLGGEGGQSLKDILQANPSLKLFLVIAGIGVLIGGFLLFTGGGEDEVDVPRSRVVEAPENAPAPGEDLTPAYEQELRQENERRIEEAKRTGRSAMPTPIGDSRQRLDAPPEAEEEDPLAQWRRAAEIRDQSEVTALQLPEQAEEEEPEPESEPEPEPEPTRQLELPDSPSPQKRLPGGQAGPGQQAPSVNPERVQALRGTMLGQMQTILGKKVPEPSTAQNVTNAQAYLEQQRQQRQQEQERATQEAAAQQASQEQPGQQGDIQGPPLIPAGEVIYAQMITQADSDIPGPVLARILTGPLKGGRAIGDFTRQEKVLVLNFTRIIKDGREYPLNGVAIDPETTLTGVATDVNNRYFSRVVVPAAAEFVSGLGEAISESGSTEVRVEGDTVVTEQEDLDTEEELAQASEEAMDRIAEFMEEETPEEIQVRVDAGTPFGLLLLSAIQAQP